MGGQTRVATAFQRTFTPADTRLPYSFFQYQADLTGLAPATFHTYTVSMNGQTIASDQSLYQFRTADSGSQFSFLVFGDSGEDTPEQQTLIQLMEAEPNIAMVVHTGDLSYPAGDYAEYEDSYFGKNAGLMRRLSFFTTPGNHDNVFNLVPYLSVHAPPQSSVPAPDLGRYYSFDWGNVHFATVDTNALGTDVAPRMLNWLDKDLQATQKYWRIVIYHHASYPTGHHLGDPICALARQQINPIVEKHGVQLVLTGHEHGYERTFSLAADTQVPDGQGTTYLISGGGGADLHNISYQPQTAVALSTYHYTRLDVSGSTLTLRAIGLDGLEIDRFILKPPPVLTGVTSASDFTSGVAAGSLISIFGRNLAEDSSASSTFPLPTQMNGARVQIGAGFIPLLFVSPAQINCQIPFDLTGDMALQVSSGNGSDETRISVASVAPGILTVTYRDKIVSSSNPAPPGSQVVAYLTGLGSVAGNIVAGQPSTSAANTVLAPVDISVGQNHVVPSFAGLAPGFAGVYQVNFTVPLSCATGNNALQIGSTGVNSRNYQLLVGPAAPLTA